MTGFAATHTGSLTPSSNPWTFVGTVTWQSDIDPAILPDNEPVVLRLAFTTLDLTGATIAFTSSGSGRAATLPANGPFDGSTDYAVASHKNRTVTYTITGVGPVGSGALAMRARSENYDLLTADGTVAYTGGDLRCDIGGQPGAYGAGGGFAGAARGGIGGRVQTSITGVSAGSLTVDFEVGRGLQNGVPDGGGATVLYNGATLLAVAGGGGGGGLDGGTGTSYGGDGGGVVGKDGEPGVTNTGYWVPHGGKGGTQSAGGVGGFFQFAEGAGAAGTYLQGGDGGGGYAPAYGTDYYGGGGGGGYYAAGSSGCGDGGSGVIVVRYPSLLPASTKALWVADDCSAVGAGNPVSSWTDQIGSLTLTESGGNRPTYRAAGVGGKPSVEFSGSNWLKSVSTDPVTSQTAGWVIAVASLDSTSGDYTFWATGDHASVAHYFVGQSASSYGFTLQAAKPSTSSQIAGSAGGMLTGPHIYEWHSDDSTWTFRRDNALKTITMAAGANDGRWFGDINTRTYFALGAFGYANMWLSRFDGHIAWLAVGDGVLSANDRAALYAHLSSLYGITI